MKLKIDEIYLPVERDGGWQVQKLSELSTDEKEKIMLAILSDFPEWRFIKEEEFRKYADAYVLQEIRRGKMGNL